MSIDIQLLPIKDTPPTREEINRCLLNIYKKLNIVQKLELLSEDVHFDPTATRKTGI